MSNYNEWKAKKREEEEKELEEEKSYYEYLDYITESKVALDEVTTSTATARGITTDLTETLSDKEEITGQELVEVKAKVETLDKAVASQSETLEELKQNYDKLSTLLPLSDLDTEEIVKTAPYILLDQKIKNIETIAKHSEDASKEAKKIANEARETAHNIQRIYILVIVLYAIVLVGLVALGIYVTFFGG